MSIYCVLYRGHYSKNGIIVLLTYQRNGYSRIIRNIFLVRNRVNRTQPKKHKPGIPFRPIVSCVDTFAYDLPAYLAYILSPLTGKSDYTVSNSTHFVPRPLAVKKYRRTKSWYLFTQNRSLPMCRSKVPHAQATLRKQENDPCLADRTTLTPKQIADLLNFVLRFTYFQYDGSIYERSSHGGTSLRGYTCSKPLHGRV